MVECRQHANLANQNQVIDRAGIGNEMTEPNSGEDDKAMTEPYSGDANTEAVEPTHNEARKITLGRKIATGLKETVLVQRRPVGRPRRE